MERQEYERFKKFYEANKQHCKAYVDMTIEDFELLLSMIDAQQQKIEQLREACIKGFSYLSLLFHRADIRNWNTVGMCSVRDVKNVLSELENAYNATKQSVSERKE